MPTTDLDYTKVRGCMIKNPLAVLGGDVYMSPADVF
jgi:hypothetical protein